MTAVDDPSRMTIWEHLIELRIRVFKVVIAVVIGAVIMWIAYPVVQDFLRQPLDAACPKSETVTTASDCPFIINNVLDGLNARLSVAGYGGIALAMPVILWQLWRFVTPGLYPNEKRYAIPFLVTSLTLFIMGAAVAYWTLPQGLGFLLTVAGDDVEALLAPQKYFGFLVYMMLAFGVGFLFPVVLVFLQLIRVLTPELLSRYRRHTIVGIVALVAVITPSGDPFTLFALAIPMCVFYELAGLIGRLIRRRRRSAVA